MTRASWHDLKTTLRINLILKAGVAAIVLGVAAAIAHGALGRSGTPGDGTRFLALFGTVLWFLGAFLVLTTGLGAVTLRAIRRTRSVLHRHGRLPARWQAKHAEHYCNRVGVKAEAEAQGFQGQLIPEIEETWTGS